MSLTPNASHLSYDPQAPAAEVTKGAAAWQQNRGKKNWQGKQWSNWKQPGGEWKKRK